VEEVQIRSRLLYYIDQLERAHGDATPGVFFDGLTYADVADRMAWRWARWKVDPAWMQRLKEGGRQWLICVSPPKSPIVQPPNWCSVIADPELTPGLIEDWQRRSGRVTKETCRPSAS